MAVSIGSFIMDIVCFWTGEILLVIFTGGRHQFIPWNKPPEPGTRVTSEKGSTWVGYIFWVSILGVVFYLVSSRN